jgi:hypothetical protein
MLRHTGATVAAILFIAVAAAGCAHKTTASEQINNALEPFSWTRNQTVALIAHNKRTLAASDINTLSVAYSDLEEKANAYASFMVEAVTTSSFDSAKNAQYASDFQKAIAAFDKAYDSVVAARFQITNTAWVPSFAQNLQASWNQYGTAVGQLQPQTKADLIAQIKRDTVWPNFENVATEPVVDKQ